jgi:hypothetical protein
MPLFHQAFAHDESALSQCPARAAQQAPRKLSAHARLKILKTMGYKAYAEKLMAFSPMPAATAR